MRAIGCNQCWYSLFAGVQHQQVWGGYKLPFVTLLSHVDWFHDLGICRLYFVGLLDKVGTFVYYSYIHIGNLGAVILPAIWA